MSMANRSIKANQGKQRAEICRKFSLVCLYNIHICMCVCVYFGGKPSGCKQTFMAINYKIDMCRTKAKLSGFR